VKKDWKKRDTYTQKPEDVTRAPSELALGTSKAGSCPKQQGDKDIGAFPQVSFPLAWQQSLADSPTGDSWSQGLQVPTFKATFRTRISSHKHQRLFVCSAPTQSVKSPGWFRYWRQSPRKRLVSLEVDNHHPQGSRYLALGKAHLLLEPDGCPFLFFPTFGLLYDYHHTIPTSCGAKRTAELVSRNTHTYKPASLLSAVAFYSPWVSNKPGLSISLTV